MRSNRRTYELWALVSIGLASLYVAHEMVTQGKVGEAFGALLLVVTAVVNRIGALSQSQAMQSMADHLARSQPAPPDGSVPPDGSQEP